MAKTEFYIDGLDMKKLKHILEISCYNHNYYVGDNQDLLFGLSDDDNTTEWWLVTGYHACYLGESHTSEGDKLHRYDTQQT